MALANSWFYTKTIIDGEKLLKMTHNRYRVVTSRPYVDKKGILPDGVTLTLSILEDDADYGVDKKTGEVRESNVFQTFDVTVLNRKQKFKKGDLVRLLDFDKENSVAIGFDMYIRFKDAEIIPPQGGKTNA